MFKNVSRSFFVFFVVLAVVAGCDKTKSGSSSEESAKEEQTAEHQESEGHAHKGEGEGHAHDDSSDEQAEGEAELVEVTEEGKKFEPSVDVSRIPQGAWHCNMNDKVHYAATKKGDGECPVCGMDLKKK
ncbi:MAG: hypothetical protein ABEK29_06820 [Bradymonadaceae bacterium]